MTESAGRWRLIGIGQGRGRWLGPATVVAALLVAPVPAAAQTPAQDGPPLCGTEGEGPPAEDGVLRAGTYNILHTQPDLADRSQDLRVELIVDELDAAGVDVVGLQEVTWSDNHGLVTQRIAAGLAAAQGGEWSWCHYASNPHCPDEPDQEPGGRGGECSAGIADQARSGDSAWYEGVSIVSRYPIVDSGAHRLVGRAQEIPLCAVEQPDNPLCVPTLTLDTRTVVWARVDSPWGGIDYFTSHLANNETSLSEQTRQLQVEDALNHLAGLATADGTPDVYVGDFNTLEDGPVWQRVIDEGFLDGYREAEPAADGFTSGQELDAPQATVTKRIDFVFVRPGGCDVTPSDGTIVGDEPAPFEDGVVWPSDHFGAAVTLQLAAPCVGPTVADPEPEPEPEPQPEPDDLPVTGGAAPAMLAAVLVLGGAWLSRGTAMSGR